MGWVARSKGVCDPLEWVGDPLEGGR